MQCNCRPDLDLGDVPLGLEVMLVHAKQGWGPGNGASVGPYYGDWKVHVV